jgi:hypothetical protein
MKTYRKGRYHVTIEHDGAIRVKPRDWLSKYSMAIWNDFWHVHEYGRLNRQGVLEPVRNVNLIYAGETLYHLPTCQAARKSAASGSPAPAQPVPQSPFMSNAEKKRITLETLKGDFHLRGEQLEFLGKAIDYIGYADSGLTIVELVGAISEGTLLATGTSLASMILSPFGILISIVNAGELGQRMYGMRAIAYTITAWAFDSPIPTSSPVIIANRIAWPGRDIWTRDEPAFRQAWNDAKEGTLRNIPQVMAKMKLTKQGYQLTLKILGNNLPKQLCQALLTGLDKEFQANDLRAWKSQCENEYPS